jgi:hypothetical protein
MSEPIVNQELAVRISLPTSTPITGSIPSENTLLTKDSTATTPSYEKMVVDETLKVSTISTVKTISTGGIIKGSTSALAARFILDPTGRTIKIQISNDNFTTWTDSGAEWDV